ncbi:P-loop containing nucleoside triphosphate hydrolase [Ostreococcus tauri]|uniref:Obg-like ATPase 1 n=1 Tax=Ostreococcus tauri TaxID=70448 RepID=Q01ER9_OSTTA|nr:P-loop containing nucleoside triphosphate hydrolase [Ostreococcus tauri]CAL52183.1 P-loop containing nucleoside triphosphate hydrolase [Ostreococcus tauri]|eukprot:XP_003074915.1 P-loop containing nucleoside triphosphate hydrolase [Ostreococcus tauri]
MQPQVLNRGISYALKGEQSLFAYFRPKSTPTRSGHFGSHRTAHSTSTCRASLKTGIVGLPNVGKSTLFNALVENSRAQAANFPFCTIEPNFGIVPVSDKRLETLAAISRSSNIVPATVEIVDIAGLVKGASEGEGLGNKFLANIRECDAIVHVVRCFNDDNIVHVNGIVDPRRDAAIINTELALADMGQIQKRMEKIQKAKGKVSVTGQTAESELKVLADILSQLEQGKQVRQMELNDDDRYIITELRLLTAKPCIYAANVPEGDLATNGADNVHFKALADFAVESGAGITCVSAQVAAELKDLTEEDRVDYLLCIGTNSDGTSELIETAYRQLELLTYFTTGEKETRAWTIRRGFTAPQAAGVIHTDFEKGFIKAETVHYDDFVSSGGFTGAKENGLLQLEGKDYVVQEGDVMVFKFNV